MLKHFFRQMMIAGSIICGASIVSFGQWTTSGSTVYLTTTGNSVAIGTTTMTAGTKLDILGNGSGGTPLTIKNNTSNVLAVYAANASSGTLASFQSYRARGTVAAPSAVLAGDRIGGFYGSAYINGGYQASAAMEMYVGASPGVGSYPAYLFFGTTPTGGTTRLERMRITEAGNVGIGTSAPGTRLEVSGGIVRISTNTYGFLQVGAYNSTDNFGYVSSAGQNGGTGLKFQTTDGPSTGNGATRMTITNTGNVGIGTTSPGSTYMLDVNGYINATGLYVNGQPFAGGGGSSQWTTGGSGISYSGGSVGIGTTAPSRKLEIANSGAESAIQVTGEFNQQSAIYFSGTTPSALTAIYRAINTNDLRVWGTNGGDIAIFKNDGSGKVGIGTTNPDAKLTVNGTIHAKEVRVDLSVPGPDYVFDKDYQLLSLDDVRAYIEKHHHLPDVPSAAEMEKNGVNVSEMNMILLRKVEELTLHLINVTKRLESLEADGKKRQ